MKSKGTIGIIGGGIVGMSTAMQLVQQLPSWKITVIEKEKDLALHQTGNNSGVIHSGIYYKPGSEKALNCISGYQKLVHFCTENSVPFEICGKIIVASEKKDRPILEGVLQRGIQNGLSGIKKISAEAAKEIEPHVECIEAIWVPQAGIINYKKVCQKYAEIFSKNGGEILYKKQVIGIKPIRENVHVTCEDQEFQFDYLITCAGLWSDKITKMTTPEFDGMNIPFRGEYYVLAPEKQHLVRNLIYPTPNPNFPFLGVHFTRMIEGGVEAGPNAVLAFKREGYHRSQIEYKELFEVLKFKGFQKIAKKYWRDGLSELYRSYSKAAFLKALQKLVPTISSSDIQPGGAGVRAQICGADGQLYDDFVILQNERVINVVNAPSPAATASLAIGEKISKLAIQKIQNQ